MGIIKKPTLRQKRFWHALFQISKSKNYSVHTHIVYYPR